MGAIIYKDVIDAIVAVPHDELVKAVFNAPKAGAAKAVVKPILLKSAKAWQCEKIIDNAAFHENVSETSLREFLERLLNENSYRQITVITSDSIITYRVSKKLKLHVSKTANQMPAKPTLAHDNAKNYILTEGMQVLPLVDLGVFTRDFRVVKAKYHKFRQINSFLKNIDSSLSLGAAGALNIVEFGCGKSYLTFILYYYFAFVKKIDVRITGYDKNRSVVDFCNGVARKYEYGNIEFVEGDISQAFPRQGDVDMIVTLHACDTATDHALHYAIQNKVKNIFCVPCCQQEVNAQIGRDDEYAILLRHGLFKERFSALLTDCVRCEALSENGYSVDVVEFVGEENTPKNAMIRARYTGRKKAGGDALQKLLSQFGVEHTLLKLLGDAQKN